MTKKFYLLLGVVFIVSTSVCAFAQGKDPNAAEVLRRYKESLSYFQSISMKIDIEIRASESDRKYAPRKEIFVFRRDHDRTEWIGESLVLDKDGRVDPSISFVLNEVMTGEYYGSVIGTINEFPRLATIRKDYKERQKRKFDDPEHGGALLGKMFGNSHKGIAELLGEAAGLYLRDEQENISGVSCYVLEATTKHGKVTAWVAPEKGHNALKWSIHKTSGDLFNKRPIYSDSCLAVFDSVEVQKVNDVFVTTGGCLTYTVNFADGRTNVSHHKYKVSEVDLNPDFEALGAFAFNLPDGTRVSVEEYPGVRYIWQSGKIVPDVDAPTFEEIDKMVDEIKKEKK
jgi:hypothetical protein